eukprot:Hpha_TRINITY_DN34693_c0_g1::TRINITY_DN34693_c0_g1_i1::g.21071::m.21071
MPSVSILMIFAAAAASSSGDDPFSEWGEGCDGPDLPESPLSEIGRYLQCRPVLVRQAKGHLMDIARKFSSEAIEHILDALVDVPEDEGGLSWESDVELRNNNRQYPPLKAWREGLSKGYTMIFKHVQVRHAALAELCGAFTRSLRLHCNVNVYYTQGPKDAGKPLEKGAFGQHRDTSDVFVIMLEGAKKWSVRRPVGLPLADTWGGNDSSTAELVTLEARAGDVIYLPQGTPHDAALDSGGSGSLHLSVAISNAEGREVSGGLHTALRTRALLGDLSWKEQRGQHILLAAASTALPILRRQVYTIEQGTRLLKRAAVEAASWIEEGMEAKRPRVSLKEMRRNEVGPWLTRGRGVHPEDYADDEDFNKYALDAVAELRSISEVEMRYAAEAAITCHCRGQLVVPEQHEVTRGVSALTRSSKTTKPPTPLHVTGPKSCFNAPWAEACFEEPTKWQGHMGDISTLREVQSWPYLIAWGGWIHPRAKTTSEWKSLAELKV